MNNTIKFFKIDKGNVLRTIEGTETNARISSFVEKILTFTEVEFIRCNPVTQKFYREAFRGNVKEFISKYELNEECIYIPFKEPGDDYEYDNLVKLLNESKIDVTSSGLEIIKVKSCNFTIRHEEDGKVLFDKTVTNPEEILDVILEYYKNYCSADIHDMKQVFDYNLNDLASFINTYLK